MTGQLESKMIKRIFSVILFMFIFLQNYCIAQNLATSSITAKFNTYQQNNFQEKLYIHTDKNSYLAGEIIWFKIYNAEAFTNRLANVSKVAYVEILDSENKPVLQSKITLKQGKGTGSLYMPISLHSGNYQLIAYTSWMKNFSSDGYFAKDLAIYNTLNEETAIETNENKEAFAIQFFPEGGNLISGLNSKIAFKAVDHNGKSFDFKAVVINSQRDTVDRFVSQKFGLGSFDFVPKNEEVYSVLIIPTSGKRFTVALPTARKNGVVMAVQRNNNAELSVFLQRSSLQNQKFTLCVFSGHKVTFIKEFESNNKLAIATSLLGDGISYFTVFDELGNPVCERLYFKRPEKLLKVELNLDKQEYRPRENVKLSVTTSNDRASVQSDFSVSVYQADSLSSADDIATSLWLTSELKGKIQNANWYFKDASFEELDLLLLVHGWRRFKWQDVLVNQNFKYLPEIEGHIVSAKITDPATGKPVANRIIFLSILQKYPQLYTSASNNDGEIKFYTKNLYGSHDLIAQTDFREDSLSVIKIESPYASKFVHERPNAFKLPHYAGNLLQRSVAMQVNNTFFSKYFNAQHTPPMDSTAFYGRPDKTYKLDEYVRFTTMEEVLREYVTEVMVTLRKKNYSLNIFDKDFDTFHSSSPLILIDGVPIFSDGNDVIGIDPRNIKRLEVISSTYFYGRTTSPGIANFYSFKTDLAGYQLPKNALAIDYDGLQTQREFYSPMYKDDTANADHIPDYRTTLFWSPSNQTYKEGKSQLNFHTSDLDGEYVVRIQAISNNGEMGTASTILKVNK